MLRRRSSAAASASETERPSPSPDDPPAEQRPPNPIRRGALGATIHAVFMLIFTGWLLNSRDSELSYIFGEMVRERVLGLELLDSDTEVATDFYGITSLTGVQQYLHGPFIEALFGEQVALSTGDLVEPSEWGWVLAQSRMVGAARLRQVRVATNSCDTLGGGYEQMQHLASSCYPKLNRGRRRTAPLHGVDLGGGMRRVYRYTPSDGADLPFYGTMYGYWDGGYIVDIPPRRLYAGELMQQLERDLFLSPSETRALFVDFTLYNANINVFCVGRLLFEFLETGAVMPYASVRTSRLLPYDGDSGRMQFALDGAIIAYVAAAMIHGLLGMNDARRRRQLRSHVRRGWFVLDWTILILFWAILSSRYYIRRKMRGLAKATEERGVDPYTHYPLAGAAKAAHLEVNLLAVMALLIYFKLFKWMVREADTSPQPPTPRAPTPT